MRKPLIVAVVALGLNAWAQSVEVKTPKTHTISGASETHQHECQPNEDVFIDGASNTVTLTGPCRELQVDGANNKVTAEIIGSVSIEGANNLVTWKKALSGKKPKVTTDGAGNTVKQAK
jgi:hypothetical protein